LAQMHRLFRIEDDPDFETFPKALMLFDDVSLMGSPPAPIVDDERRDLMQSRVLATEVGRKVDEAFAHDRALKRAFEVRFGSARFVEQPLEARRVYLTQWGASAF